MILFWTMNRMSSANSVVLGQTSVLSPMGIQQDIVSFEDKIDDLKNDYQD